MCVLTFLYRFTCTKKSCWQNGETIILLSSNIYHILLYIYTLHIYIYTSYVNKLIFFFNVSLYIIQLLYTDIMAALIVSTIIAYSHNILIILLRNLILWLSLEVPILRQVPGSNFYIFRVVPGSNFQGFLWLPHLSFKRILVSCLTFQGCFPSPSVHFQFF